MTTHNHFDTIADNFDGLWQMTPEYKNWMVEKIILFLDLATDDIFVDLGGGTGLYTKLIIEKSQLQNRAICVEPSSKMLSQMAQINLILPVNMDAVSFSKEKILYDKILLKEMIHFVGNRSELFSGIQKQLSDHGKMLIVTRPKNTTLPFFDSALKTFSESQPALEILQNELTHLHINHVCFQEEFTFSIPKVKWFEMLKNKFMSNLQDIPDQDIQYGLMELAEKFALVETIEICDQILFIQCNQITN